MNDPLYQTIKDGYDRARMRLLLLDYDGTLVPFTVRPAEAIPDAATRDLINDLAARKGNTLVIISGRDRDFLEKIFAGMKVTLVAEHGLFIRKPGSSWETASVLRGEWKREAMTVLDRGRQRFPGSMIEEKAGSVAWHYRNCPVQPDKRSVTELVAGLEKTIASHDLDVLMGNCVVEIKNRKVSKGLAALSLISKADYRFILAAGDDVTDEDLFRALPESAHSIKIGYGLTAAKYCCLSIGNLTALLRFLLH